ncbi:hypothetical protein BGX21_006446 [Mortierella sp. AD011]|nr:hypothetical protein BGX20_006488 [Mortierella sp. AD010]KAF9399331.1 hypothetical protein BGX21_006446 [Mortierella sp. AD011]
MLSVFPNVSFRQSQALPQNEDNDGSNKQDWKETFIIHSRWLTRKAQTLVLSPCQPPVIPDNLEPSPTSFESEVQRVEDDDHHQHQHQDHQHQHQHHQYQLLDQHVQENSHSSRNNDTQPIHEPPLVKHPTSLLTTADNGWDKPDVAETLNCSLCTYADICMIPQAKICVRTHRNRSRPLMQVLDWSLHEAVNIGDSVDCHQDLVSGMAVNDQGSLLVSCSIDGSVRVWDVNPGWLQVNGEHKVGMATFKSNIQKYGCPINTRVLLLGHIGWVNAVAIENTTVVSGGSDHTVRVWDGLSGALIRLIPNLFFTRSVGHGVYTVAIRGSLIGSGSILEGYNIHDLETGQLVMDLDEPLSSKDHFQFESLIYQHYASRIVITDTTVVTNSKKEGMLCVWDRRTGEFMYRIQVCPQRELNPGSSLRNRKRLPNTTPMVTFTASDPNANLNRATTGPITADDLRSELTVHTFNINKSGSVLMCTLCNGRVSLIDFGNSSATLKGPLEIQASGHGTLVPRSANMRPLGPQEEHRCGTLAWVWMRDTQGRGRVVLV